jgi:hypothetical protein
MATTYTPNLDADELSVGVQIVYRRTSKVERVKREGSYGDLEEKQHPPWLWPENLPGRAL